MQATFKPCLSSITPKKFEACSKASGVPVSSQAIPLPIFSTLNCLRFKYSLLTSVISNSPLADGLRFFEIFITSLLNI